MKIEIVGPGCSKCKFLAEQVSLACKEAGIKADVSKTTEIDEIVAKGIFSTPGLIIDGKVKSTGRVPTITEIKKFLKAK